MASPRKRRARKAARLAALRPKPVTVPPVVPELPKEVAPPIVEVEEKPLKKRNKTRKSSAKSK